MPDGRLNATLALLSALLYAASFPPLGCSALAWLALIPLLVALSRVGPAAGAGLALLSACATGAALASWLPGMIGSYFELEPSHALLGSSAAVLLCVFPYALFGAVVSWASRRGCLGPGVVALAWGGCELFRAQGPLPMPFGFLAYTQSSWLAFAQAADVVGAVGLSMLMAALNACAAGVVARRCRSPHFARTLALSGATLALTLIYGQLRLATDFGLGEPIRVALVQGALDREQRFDPARRGANLAHHLELSERARRAAPDLVLWPELSVEFAPAAEPALWQRIQAHSRSLDGDLLFGAPHVRHRLFVREELNSAFLMRAGRVVGRHDKVYLMPFSETRPPLLPLGVDRYRAGDALRPLASGAGQLGVLLCSEGMLPGPAALLAAAGAEVLVNPSNDDWFASPAAAEHQLAAAVFRAIENRRPLLRPSTSGRSAVVDAHGRILAATPYREAGVVVAEVRRSRARTPHQQLARVLGTPAAPLAALPLLALASLRRGNS